MMKLWIRLLQPIRVKLICEGYMVRLSLNQCSVDTTEREVPGGGPRFYIYAGIDKGLQNSWGVFEGESRSSVVS